MSLMIVLSNKVSVDAAYVTSTHINDEKNAITVKMHNGEEYTVRCNYGQSIFATHDELVAKINEARG